MSHKDENIEIRSEEVQEILGHIPHWLVRRGITMVFIIIIMLLIISWVIKYPEIIDGKVTLTTENPPVKIVTQSSGKIEHIYINDGEYLSKGDIIAEVENPVSKKSIDYLLAIISDVNDFLKNPKQEVVFTEDDSLVFGGLQQEYNILKKNIRDYHQQMTDPHFRQQINHLKHQIKYHQKLVNITDQQIIYNEREGKNAEVKLQINKELLKNKAISKIDFFNEESHFLAIKKELENLKKSFVNHNITLVDKENQLTTLTHEFNRKQRTLKEQIITTTHNISNFIHSWKQTNTLTSPINGRLSYINHLSENQHVEANLTLFAIVPADIEIIAQVYIPSQGYGKIELGQYAKIKLDHYPFQEYGQLNGVVNQVSPIPNKENQYKVDISLSDGLNTTFKKELDFKPEMTGSVKIITKDLRLIERVFDTFRKVIDR